MKNYAFDRQQRLPLPSVIPPLPGLTIDESPITHVAGVDEVGRGPLAGPVVSAAVILPDAPMIRGLRDSKALTARQRENLYAVIMERAVATAVSIVENEVIDSLNILHAALHSMRECVSKLAVKPGLVLVDGNQKPGSGFPERAIIKGDSLSAAIMAASIVAKVTRDRIMTDMHERFPAYGFDKHKGYACRAHLDALKEHGPCAIHRRSFDPVRSWLTAGVDLLSS